MRHLWVGVVVVCVALVTACKEEDTTAPPAPRVDPYASPTGAPEITLTGSAEYGATVRITGGQSAVTTTADPFTALWRARVSLFVPPAPATPET
ncbi:MAG: hypothetical protein HYZ27_06110, partial [Deltaproteobacteria bacterium]|nr:hypothetical protein [Deltaproteobacteria bacterium]